MLTRAHSHLLVAAVLLATGCASSGESGPRRSRDVITSEELMEVPHSTVFDAVRALRPRWLQPRNMGSLRSQVQQTPRVYVDGQFRGDLVELSRYAPNEVEEIRYMNASDATTRFGTNHVAGAIIVTTRRR
ncbi:MAG: hypothetical protein OXH51_06950 [Gemmatimonadetes bacterium]|nr:hypothetical protein [Gemmatimonadota bacterium]MCY3611254.1 hypothetical protein [Gemmatimonadota bacterium]MCY3676216.1 hypothetical protein [Gemmatimonadota bacterium]MYA41467.1 hypothetical protein [Gemmatimonadota bacterium]MYE93233.1 hypothetical protein [Gemmatimonadota bacterium]